MFGFLQFGDPSNWSPPACLQPPYTEREEGAVCSRAGRTNHPTPEHEGSLRAQAPHAMHPRSLPQPNCRERPQTARFPQGQEYMLWEEVISQGKQCSLTEAKSTWRVTLNFKVHMKLFANSCEL